MHVFIIISKYQALSKLSWRINATLRQTHLDYIGLSTSEHASTQHCRVFSPQSAAVTFVALVFIKHTEQVACNDP